MGAWSCVTALQLMLLVESVDAAEAEVTCWGVNGAGQLDAPPDLGGVVLVSMGHQHACSLTQDGNVACWGSNEDGRATVPAELASIAAGVSAGGHHTCAWTTAGAVVCWGRNDEGQSTVSGGLGFVVGVSAGWSSNCAWNTAGDVSCWGLDDYGQGTVPADLDPTAGVSLGSGRHACAWTEAGAVRCWGSDDHGQSAIPSSLGVVLQVASGGNHTCALKADRKVQCWGDSSSQQLNVPLLSGALNVAAGSRHNCAGEQGVVCWGASGDSESVVPAAVAGGGSMLVTSFDRSTCAWATTQTTSSLSRTTTTTTLSTQTSSSSTASTASSTATAASVLAQQAREFLIAFEADVRNASLNLMSQARENPGTWAEQTVVGHIEAVTVAPENLTIRLSYLNIGNTALVPAELLRAFGEPTVVLVTEVSSAYLEQKLQESGKDFGEVFAMVDVSVYLVRTGELAASAGEPHRRIFLRLAREAEPSQRVPGVCVQGDGHTWSTKGMRKADGGELARSSQQALQRALQQDPLTTTGVWCSSEHISVFAFLLGPVLTCGRANVADLEGALAAASSWLLWIISMPALLLFVLLLFLAGTHVYALRTDRKFRKFRAAGDMWSLEASYFSMGQLLCQLTAPRHSASLPAEVVRSFGTRCGLSLRCWIFFRAFHPLLSLGDPPLQLSCTKNAKLLTDTILGSLVVLALAFSYTGEIRAVGSDADCVPLGFKTGCMLCVVVLGVLVCGLLSRFLACHLPCETDHQLSVARDAAFWGIGLLWTVLQLACTLVFLVQVAVEDAWKWALALLWLLVFVFVVKPLLVAVGLSVWSGLVVYSRPELIQDSGTQPAVSSGVPVNHTGDDELLGLDDVQRATVKNLAQRGITVAHLLDFYQKLGAVVMPQFDPLLATTEDVVRQAIIPLSRADASKVYGVPLKVKIGLLHLTAQVGTVCDVFCRCEVPNRPLAVLDTWPVLTVGLRQMDWSMEAEMLDVRPGDGISLSLIEADTGRKLCVGNLQPRQLSGDFVVPLISGTNKMGSVTLHIMSPPSVMSPRVLSKTEAVPPAAYHSQGYLEWCGVEQEEEHPAVADLCWVVPDCRSKRETATMVQLGEVEINISQPAPLWSSNLDEVLMPMPPPRTRTVLGTSYASAVNEPILPSKMVTHNWGSCFTHLMACVIADALGEETYGHLLPLLAARNTAKLRSLLGAAGKLGASYWICAFSVNQHTSICADVPSLTDSMGTRFTPCSCATPKVASGPVCEVDKMPFMMAYLNALWAERGAEFEHVVAVDPGQGLFNRAWCIAELHEAYLASMPQTFVLHSSADLDAKAQRLVVDGIDIRTSKAYCESDKTHILSKIDDVDTFNEHVRCLVNLHLKNTFVAPAQKMSLMAVFLDMLLK